MSDSPTKRFNLMVYDLLQLMAKKSKQAAVNQEAAKELQVLEQTYDMMMAIIQSCEADLQSAAMQVTYERAISKILESEIRKAYNHVYQVAPGRLAEIMKHTVLPTKKELETPITIKA